MRWLTGCPLPALPASSSGPGAGIRLSRHQRHPTLPSIWPANEGRPQICEDWVTQQPCGCFCSGLPGRGARAEWEAVTLEKTWSNVCSSEI